MKHLRIKKHLWAVIYEIALTGYVVFTLLDAFVIPKNVVVLNNNESSVSEDILAEYFNHNTGTNRIKYCICHPFNIVPDIGYVFIPAYVSVSIISYCNNTCKQWNIIAAYTLIKTTSVIILAVISDITFLIQLFLYTFVRILCYN